MGSKHQREQYLKGLRRRRGFAKWQAKLDRQQTIIRFVVNPLIVLGAGVLFGLAHHDLTRIAAGAVFALVVLFEAVVWRFRRPQSQPIRPGRHDKPRFD